MKERRARLGELAPVLAAQSLGRKPIFLKKRQRQRVYLAHRITPSAEGFEFRSSDKIEDRLGHDAPRRIAGAKK